MKIQLPPGRKQMNKNVATAHSIKPNKNLNLHDRSDRGENHVEVEDEEITIDYIIWLFRMGLRETAYIVSQSSNWPAPVETDDMIFPFNKK